MNKIFPIIVMVPNSWSIESAQKLTKSMADLIDTDKLTDESYHVCFNTKDEMDIILPRFIGLRRYLKIKKKAINNLKKIAEMEIK